MIAIAAIQSGKDWDRSLDRLPPECQDIYFTARYHALHVQNGDGEGYCCSVTDGSNKLLVPGLRMAIPRSGTGGSPPFDLQTCNGYGGPLTSFGVDRSFIESAWAAWRQQAAADGIVAAFFRLHPIIENHQWLPSNAMVLDDRKTIIVDVENGADAVLVAADSRHRNMVNKGRRSGAKLEWDTDKVWRDFVALYNQSMIRLSAPAALRFSDGYFSALRNLPEARIAGIYEDGRLASASTFLFGSSWAHYHLSAREPWAPNYSTNLILQDAVESAWRLGLRALHLGGGRTSAPDDKLLAFKQSLGGRLLSFKVALVVANSDSYSKLCESWAVAAGRAPSWLLGYRQPQ